MAWIYQTRRSSPISIEKTLKGKSAVSNLRRRLVKYTYLGRTAQPGDLIVDVGWTVGIRPNCRTEPVYGVCTSLGGLKMEYYALSPLHIVAQQYYYDSIGRKGYWYEYRYEGSTGRTYSAWYDAANAATNSSNVSWINNGKASSAVQVETRDHAIAMTRPVLLRKIAEHLQTSRTRVRDEIARQNQRELEEQSPPQSIPWLPIAVVGGGVLLYMRTMRG